MTQLTEREIDWMARLQASADDVRTQLVAGTIPSYKDLLNLLNRAEALLWELRKREGEKAEATA